ADHMLDLGFIKDIRDVLRHLPAKRQTLFFSATIDKDIKKLAYEIVENPIRIQISPKDPVSKNVTHSVAYISMDDKRFFLERLINEAPNAKILVFVRTKVRAERVFEAMKRVGVETLTMHGDKDQQDRLSVLSDFKSGKSRILIATDVSSRGIHIDNVDYVVNYDLPDVPENYVHRVGRTGRGDKKGFAVSFCSEEEKGLLAEIEKLIGKPVEVKNIDKDDYSETLDFSEDADFNWKALMKDAIQAEDNFVPKKKKEKKKK
ncbi:MAG: DEAD/DEAH box helicase, partial [Bacteroidia bacterium]|nr:DEAD/DEAH box helicase [Bacteroidia bacterium]